MIVSNVEFFLWYSNSRILFSVLWHFPAYWNKAALVKRDEKVEFQILNYEQVKELMKWLLLVINLIDQIEQNNIMKVDNEADIQHQEVLFLPPLLLGSSSSSDLANGTAGSASSPGASGPAPPPAGSRRERQNRASTGSSGGPASRAHRNSMPASSSTNSTPSSSGTTPSRAASTAGQGMYLIYIKSSFGIIFNFCLCSYFRQTYTVSKYFIACKLNTRWNC